MELTKEVLDKIAGITGEWVSDILNIADRYGIDRNSFIKHCTTALVMANATTDFTNLDISTLKSKATE